MSKFLVLHGPNLNLLGRRETHIYGDMTLMDLNKSIAQNSNSHDITFLQSNAEHILIEAIHQAMDDGIEGIIINPAGFTHTSIALRDALLASNIIFIEVHLSNVYSREPFRQNSYFSDIALGVISGFGVEGYISALNLLIKKVESK
jgi:3-dehydroquinate dehydratase-2